MSIVTQGKVFLGTKVGGAFPAAAQFTTDPTDISRAWPPRRRRVGGIQGAVTQQDWGRFAKDMRLTLTSGDNYINAAFKAYVDGLIAVRGAVYDYQDYQGTVGQVVIVDFQPKPSFIRDGLTVLYTYTMVLDVTSLSQLEFAPYTGN